MEDIVKEAREGLQLSYDFDKNNRKEAIEDLRFTAGFQWSDTAKAERVGRPMITINRSQQFVRQVSNPIRQNMPTLKVEPDGDDDEQMADIANGLLRRIQYNSSASHVYANAVEHMVACGIGWFRVVADYTNDNSFDQELMIKRVFNPLSVYPDPSSLEPDRSDMNWCVVSELWPLAAFKKKWPGKAVQSIDSPSSSTSSDIAWSTNETVRVAEYWRRKEATKKMVQLTNGDVVDFETMLKFAPQYAEQVKPHIANERSVKTFTVEMQMVSGSEILDEAYECPCKWIPIIPVIGGEIPLEDGTYRHGLIRFQREPQQLHNYFMSVAAETLAQQPKSPFAVTPKQIEGFKHIWDNHNVKPTPYLPYNTDPMTPGPPQRIAPPPLPAGLVQMAQMMSDDMKATTGIYDAALGARSNETSGVAIQGRVQQGEQSSYHFVDNLEHGLEHLGRVLLDMIPKVYDTERTLRIRGADDTEQTVTINKSLGGYDGQDMMHNDMSQMSFSSVRVVLGESYASQRQQAVQTLMTLIQAVPEVGAVSADLIAKNLDFDGAEELRERLHALLPPQVLQLEQGGQPGAPPPPDPMQQAQQQAQMDIAGSEARKASAQADEAEAKAQQAQMKIGQEQQRTQGGALDNALKVKKLREPPPSRGTEKSNGSQPPKEAAF